MPNIDERRNPLGWTNYCTRFRLIDGKKELCGLRYFVRSIEINRETMTRYTDESMTEKHECRGQAFVVEARVFTTRNKDDARLDEAIEGQRRAKKGDEPVARTPKQSNGPSWLHPEGERLPGEVLWSRPKRTVLLDAKKEGKVAGIRWSLFCEKHSVTFTGDPKLTKRADAEKLMYRPEEWCEGHE